MPGRKESTDLFKLIKSLTPEEKSYFRKFSKRHTDKGSNALKLFDKINGKAEYNEKELKIHFSNFAVLKQNLFDNIIQSLIVSYNKPQNKIAFLKILLEIELLRERKLFDRAYLLIKKYLPVAKEAGLLFFEEDLLRAQNLQLLAKLDGHGRIAQQLKYEQEYAEFCKRKENMDLMVSINQKLFAIDMLAVASPDDYPNPDMYVDLKFLENSNSALSPMAENARRLNLSLYYSIKQDLEKYYQLSKESYNQAAKQKNKGGKYNELYIKAMRGLIYGAIICGRFREAEKLIEKHSSLRMNSQWERSEHILVTNMMWQNLLWSNGRHSIGVQFSNEQLAKTDYAIETGGNYIFAKNFFQFKLLFEFSVGDVRAMYLSAGSLHQIAIKDEVEEIDKHVEILKILAQVREKNYELIPGMVNNLRRSKAGKKLCTKEKRLLDKLKSMNEINAAQVLKQLHADFSRKGNQIGIFGQHDLADMLLGIQKGNTLSILFAARQID